MILIKQKPKYIRTKEHIYKRYFIDQAIMNECGYGHCDKDLNPIEETIIKESDTIEELCDEFVVVGVPNRTFIIDEKDYKEQGLTLKQYVNFLYAQYNNCKVYGAIWTDKGLIYVAKMNEKGELELI